MSSPEIKPAGAAERQWMEAKKHELFRGDIIVSRGRAHRPLELPGFVAYVDGTPMGAAVYEIRDTQCELVSLHTSKAVRRAARDALDRIKRRKTKDR